MPAATVDPSTAHASPAAPAFALTPRQRLQLEIDGFVLVPNLVAPDQVRELRARLDEAEARYRRDGGLPQGAWACATRPDYFRIDHLGHVAPCFHRYLTDPRIVAIAEEMVGGAVRIEQSDAHIRRAPEGRDHEFRFHRGCYTGFAYTEDGLYHFPFVKALTNLTDLGPDDGGTTVIPGSHKLSPRLDRALIASALADPSLTYRVEAPAGSTLFFYESLLHTGGAIRSGRPRALVIGGYAATPFQAWRGYDPDPAFLATLGERDRELYAGDRRWEWPTRFRKLDAEGEGDA